MATLSKYTLRNYTAAIGRLQRAGLTLNNYDEVCAWVDENAPSAHSKKLYYASLGYTFATSDPALTQRYREKMKPINEVITQTSREQRLTAMERDKYLPYDDICKVYKRLSYCPYTTHEDTLLVGFYTQMPPVRSDYSRLRVYLNEEPDMTINHIEIRGSEDDIEDSEMTVRIVEHKTASSSGTLTRTLPESLRRDVAILIYGHRLIHSDSNPEYLFDFPEYEITTRLQSVFLRYTGKAISVNIIRHAYITKQTEGRPPLAQLEAEAAEMGHSVLTHETYRKLDA
jgi:hypothetical protein